MRSAALFSLLVIPQLLAGCKCASSRSVCQTVANSDLVFIGTVEAVQPSLLDRLNLSVRGDWMRDPEIVKLKKDRSELALEKLKERYLKLFSDLPDSEKLQIEAVSSQERLQTVMAWIQNQGTRVRFKVQTLIQKKEDEEADKLEFAEVWNDLGDCGVLFQRGESYLVYADDDEETGHLQTSVCTGTTRLSDAGDDLAYLHFFQQDSAKSLRLEGFLTSAYDQLSLDPFQYSGKIKSPVSNVVVELRSGDVTRYSEPDEYGRFVFDGLTQGDYQVSVFESGFPERVAKLSGPKRVHLEKGRCGMTTLLVLSRSLIQ